MRLLLIIVRSRVWCRKRTFASMAAIRRGRRSGAQPLYNAGPLESTRRQHGLSHRQFVRHRARPSFLHRPHDGSGLLLARVCKSTSYKPLGSLGTFSGHQSSHQTLPAESDRRRGHSAYKTEIRRPAGNRGQYPWHSRSVTACSASRYLRASRRTLLGRDEGRTAR